MRLTARANAGIVLYDTAASGAPPPPRRTEMMAATLDELRQRIADFPDKLSSAKLSHDLAMRDLWKREERLDAAGAKIEQAAELADSDLPAAERLLEDAEDEMSGWL